MKYLELVKLLGLTDLVICLLDEQGVKGVDIARRLEVSEQTIYNAKKRYESLTETLKLGENIQLATNAQVENSPVENSNSNIELVKQDMRNPDVQKIIDAFQTAFGTTTASRYDRFAASRLAKKYGADEIVKVIEVLASNRTDKYTPTVNSVRQIEQKWVNIANFFARMQGQSERIDL